MPSKNANTKMYDNYVAGDIQTAEEVNSNAQLAVSVSGTQSIAGQKTFTLPPIGLGVVDYQVFTTPGANTWTKPAGLSGNELVRVQLWGAGGGGGAGRYDGSNGAQGGGGGGGGAYIEGVFRASDLSATVTVTIGAGGVGGIYNVNVGGGNGCGGVGENSTFGSYMTAYGGGGGNMGLWYSGGGQPYSQGGGGGGGGGALGVGDTGTQAGCNGGRPKGGKGSFAPTNVTQDILDSNMGGGAGGGARSDVNGDAGYSYSGGGGGGGHSGSGGNSVYGGGGGGAGYPSVLAGGTSVFGGAGGAGASADQHNGYAGSAPAGGGGGAFSSTTTEKVGGAGARGECRIWVLGRA